MQSSNHQLSFQCTYASLRAEMFQAHSRLLASCATVKSCPPPAIATAVAMATGQDVQRLSHFAAQVSLIEELHVVERALILAKARVVYTLNQKDLF